MTQEMREESGLRLQRYRTPCEVAYCYLKVDLGTSRKDFDFQCRGCWLDPWSGG